MELVLVGLTGLVGLCRVGLTAFIGIDGLVFWFGFIGSGKLLSAVLLACRFLFLLLFVGFYCFLCF